VLALLPEDSKILTSHKRELRTMSFADPSLPRPGGAHTEPPRQSVEESEVRRRRAMRADEEPPLVERPRGASFRRSVDWEHVGILGAGLLIGALVGAGTALLLAPQSGMETRTAIRRKARFAGHRASDAWSELADELAAVARRGRRRARRALRRARWRASDAIA
jgi:YtxH-like protein